MYHSGTSIVGDIGQEWAARTQCRSCLFEYTASDRQVKTADNKYPCGSSCSYIHTNIYGEETKSRGRGIRFNKVLVKTLAPATCLARQLSITRSIHLAVCRCLVRTGQHTLCPCATAYRETLPSRSSLCRSIGMKTAVLGPAFRYIRHLVITELAVKVIDC